MILYGHCTLKSTQLEFCHVYKASIQARFQVLVLLKHCQRKDLVIIHSISYTKGTHSEETFKNLVQCENVATRKKSQ